jgi:catechol 2,3-dioxygenase-like lactoylglutathione lyase family enzyme
VASPPALRLGVHHLAVKVRDLPRAEQFYVGVLGLRVLTRHEDERGLRSLWLAVGPTLDAGRGPHERQPFLAVERAELDEPLRSDDAPGWHCVALAIEVEEREAWRRALAAAGHEVFRETAYTLYARDPEGSVVALSHHPVPAPTASLGAAGREAAGPGESGAGAARPDSVPPPQAEITSRLSALVSVSVALLVVATALVALVAPGLGAVERAEAQRRARTPRQPADVLIVGSSSVNGALGRLIESELARAGMRPERRARSSSGFARPDFFDWEAEVPNLGDLRALRGLVVYAGGNDAQAIRLREHELPPRPEGEGRARRGGRRPDEWIVWREEARWRPVYQGRVRAFVDALCNAGARRVLVLLPAEGENEGWSGRMERIQELQDAGTRATRCGRVVDPRGVRAREGSTLDGIHLSRTGARAVWDRVGETILRELTGS